MKIIYPINEPFALAAAEVIRVLQSDIVLGISTAESENRISRFGRNEYLAQRQKSIWRMLLDQFKSAVVYLLIFGAAVSVYFGDIVEAVAILVVIVLNALIGFLMEMQARSSMLSLMKMDIMLSKVFRDGKLIEIPAEILAPGDIITLEAGDLVPGDARLLECNQLLCDESPLTGESLPSAKDITPLPKGTVPGDQHNMVFKGTAVTNGNGKAIITATGAHTQLGAITALVDSSEESTTHLDKKLNVLSKKLILLTIILTLVFAVSGFMQGSSWMVIIKTSIALAIAAFPEGLPIVSTVALAYGMLQMAKHQVIIKKLAAVETLGSTTVILTDKTGTLTQNRIHTDTVSFPEETIKVNIKNKHLRFPDGQIEKSQENFEKLALIGALCNNAAINPAKHDREQSGDPIEIALVRFAEAAGQSAEKIKKQYKRIAEEPFSADTKMMGTLHRKQKTDYVSAKGSVEHLLEKCTGIQTGATIRDITKKDRKNILSAADKMAAGGLRVLGFAGREGEHIDKHNLLTDLVYVGMVGFLDPPRTDIRKAVDSCKKAGINVVMITGDHPLTALNIAEKTGLVDDMNPVVLTGAELPAFDKLTADWKKRILATVVFARTSPKQKMDIASVFQKAGHIVAMTGDGVNDAPALKKADVGIAMGQRGTQVAKETASIVLKNDSFKSIVTAIAHGRVIFQNIQKFVIYLVSCNLSEIFIVTLLGIFAPQAILLPLQILFLNMVTDVLPALALGVGKGNQKIMEQPPRDPAGNIISNRDWITIVIYAVLISVSVLVAIIWQGEVATADPAMVNTTAFLTLAFAQLFHVFNMTSEGEGLFFNDITKNKFIWIALVICAGLLVLVYAIPGIRTILHLSLIPGRLWLITIVSGLIPFVLVQLYLGISGMFSPPAARPASA